MKTNYLKIAVMAALVAVTATGCGSGKSVVQGSSTGSSQTTDDIDRQIAQKKKQMELDALNAEADRQKRLDEIKKEELETEMKQRQQATRKIVAGEQRTIVFCMDESFDKPGEYMGGLGVVEGRPDRTRAIVDANRAAIADIASRYIGMIKNAIEDYSKDVNVPSGKKMYESSLEGGAAAIGTKVIDKYANVVCREVSQDNVGGWVGYVAVHVLLQDAKKGLADELEVRKVDYDKKKFFDKMDVELEKEAAKRKAELEAGDY
jgi:Skp family chaperone for outer membrane proteins